MASRPSYVVRSVVRPAVSTVLTAATRTKLDWQKQLPEASINLSPPPKLAARRPSEVGAAEKKKDEQVRKREQEAEVRERDNRAKLEDKAKLEESREKEAKLRQ